MYKILKKAGLVSFYLSIIASFCLLMVYLIRISVVEVISWLILVFQNKITNYIVITLIVILFCLSLGVFVFLISLLIEFFFRNYPSLILEKQKYILSEDDKKKITVIIPAYNEEKTIGQAIEAVKPYCNKIIVVNDGSTDQTEVIAERHGAIVVNHKNNKGLGQTLRDGVRKALELNSEIIVNYDADLQYKADEINSLVYYIIYDNYDLIMGSRLKGTIEEMPFLKKFGNMMYTKLLQFITKIGISDGQTGFRAFTKEFAEQIKIRGDYTYTQEMILEANAIKAKIGEVPIYFAKRKDGNSRLMKNPFHFAKSSGCFLIQVISDLYPIKFSLKIVSCLVTIALIIGLNNLIKYLTTLDTGYLFFIVICIIMILNAITLLLIAIYRKNED